MKNFKRKLTLVLVLIAAGCVSTVAQHGGKAEPLRIRFTVGGSSTTITGTLSTDQEMDHVFGAQKGQTISIRNSNPSLFDFRVFTDDGAFDTEFDSSPIVTFKAPQTGDFLLTVRKKRVKTPRSARFSLRLTIK